MYKRFNTFKVNTEKHRLFVFVLFVIFLFANCAENKRNENESLLNIIYRTYNLQPKFIYTSSFNKSDYIFTYIKNHLLIFEKTSESWRLKNEFVIDEFYIFEESQLIETADDIGVYFLNSDQGTQSGTLEFNYFSLRDLRIYTISTFGENNGHNEFSISKELSGSNRSDILDYLVKKVNQKGHLLNENDTSVRNATEIWKKSNLLLYDSLQIVSGKWFPIISKTFKLDGIEDFFNKSVNKDYIKNSRWIFENDNYTVYCYFKGSIYVYDKKEEEFFILWVPNDKYNWIERVDFYKPSAIIIHDSRENRPFYRVDLEKLLIMRI